MQVGGFGLICKAIFLKYLWWTIKADEYFICMLSVTALVCNTAGDSLVGFFCVTTNKNWSKE